MLPAAIAPAPETVGSRDVIAPTTGQKIVDYIRIGRNCDASPGADEGSCVKIMLQDARAALDEKLKQLESHDDPQPSQPLKVHSGFRRHIAAQLAPVCLMKQSARSVR